MAPVETTTELETTMSMNPTTTAEQDAIYFRERLEAWQDASRDMAERFAAVLAERDAMRAALRIADDFLTVKVTTPLEHVVTLEAVRAALAVRS